MQSGEATAGNVPIPRAVATPLYLAGFTTAFGAHGIAAALGAEAENVGLTILTSGCCLRSTMRQRSS